jgi:hypothetical protein
MDQNTLEDNREKLFEEFRERSTFGYFDSSRTNRHIFDSERRFLDNVDIGNMVRIDTSNSGNYRWLAYEGILSDSKNPAEIMAGFVEQWNNGVDIMGHRNVLGDLQFGDDGIDISSHTKGTEIYSPRMDHFSWGKSYSLFGIANLWEGRLVLEATK